MTANSEPFVTLEHALNQVFSSSLLNLKTALLTIGSNTVAIFRPFPEVLKIFDSHSRNLYGMPSSLGNCVLTSVEGLQNLVQYFQLTSHVRGVLPFELKGVTCMLQSQVDVEPVVTDNCQIPMKNNINSSSPDINVKILEDKKKRRDNARKKRENKSAEQKAERLSKQRSYAAAKRKKKAADERENRLHKGRKRIANECPDAREKRL